MKIYNCNEEKLLKQKEYLEREVLYGNNRDYFKVLDNECGTGKSATTEKALSKIENMKALLVKERNSDAIESAKRINKLANKTIAIAINSDTYNKKEFNKIKKDIWKYPILIISHEKYKVLAIDKKQREYFKKDRHSLIIDEFLNMCKGNELHITLEWIEEFETFLKHRTLRKQFEICIGEIEEYLISKKKTQSFFNSKQEYKKICKEINKLKTLVKKNLNKDYCKDKGYTKTQLIDKIEELKQFYNQTCVIEGDTVYCMDKRYQYWLLDNNIILDASAKLNKAYNLNKNLFYIQHQTQVLDHSKWTFHILKANSCKSAKDRAINYYDVVNKIIEKNNKDDTLVIGNKQDEKHIEAIHINHFGNVTGSNDYRELNNCIITHNPNMPYRLYILEYIYYSNKRFDNKNTWQGSNDGNKQNKVFRFKEKKFEEYRQNRNANEIYQAIKRINRDMSKESKIFILNNDVETIDRVLDIFKGDKKVKYYENDDIIEYEKTKMDEYNEERKNNRQAIKFIQLLQEIMQLKHINLQKQKKNRKGEYEIQKGIYQKSKLRECMKIKDKGHFKNKILDDIDVIDFLNKHNIINKGQMLDFTNII